MDATDNEAARKILWEVCRYLQEGLQGEIEGWNPRPDASEVIMYLRGYSYYRECVALKPKKNIELFVRLSEIQGKGRELWNILKDRKSQYEKAAPSDVETEWLVGPGEEIRKNTTRLVRYSVQLDWENWRTLQPQQKECLLAAFKALHNVAQDVISSADIRPRRKEVDQGLMQTATQAAILAAGRPAGRARLKSASAVLGRVAAMLRSDVSTICSRAVNSAS